MRTPFTDWVAAWCHCAVPGCTTRPVDPDHVLTKGSQGKQVDRDNVWPLCRTHHTERHRVGLGTFSKKHGVDPFQIAVEVSKRWGHVRKRMLEEERHRDGLAW